MRLLRPELLFAVGSDLWVAVGPLADRVVLLHPDRDEVRVLLPDITACCWPPGPRPAHTDSYLHRVLPEDGALDAFWSDEDYVAAPLAEGLSDSTARPAGDWPVTGR